MKINFKHSSWIELIHDRLKISKKILNNDEGFLICTIDDVEFKSLSFILEEIFEEVVGVVTIRNKPSGRPIPNGFAQSHEYAIFCRKSLNKSISRLKRSDTQLERYKENDIKGNYFWEMLRKAGSGANREDRPTMYYPFLYNPKKDEIRVPNLEWNNENQSYDTCEEISDDSITYPKKMMERMDVGTLDWILLKTVLKISKQKNNTMVIIGYITKEDSNIGVQPTTIWTDPEYSQQNMGLLYLKIFFWPKRNFDYPKSILCR